VRRAPPPSQEQAFRALLQRHPRPARGAGVRGLRPQGYGDPIQAYCTGRFHHEMALSRLERIFKFCWALQNAILAGNMHQVPAEFDGLLERR
jgi:hypothetical protein